MAENLRRRITSGLILIGLFGIASFGFQSWTKAEGRSITRPNPESGSHLAQRPGMDEAWLLAAGQNAAENNLPAHAELLADPELDTCMHCHLSGEDTGVWTPFSRWALFGTVGLVFAFGFYRSASIWTTRERWIPLSRRLFAWVDSRYEIAKPLETFLKKPVPRFATQWWYCLGGITALLFVVQALTGIMLAFYYKPTPDAAYASIQFIETEVRFGAGVRMIHHWAANGMIIVCGAHLLRVFITGAYKAPRELNWASGVLLFLLTLFFGFTGYLVKRERPRITLFVFSPTTFEFTP